MADKVDGIVIGAGHSGPAWVERACDRVCGVQPGPVRAGLLHPDRKRWWQFGLHNPNYDFNDEIIPVGASYWVKLAQSLLPA